MAERYDDEVLQLVKEASLRDFARQGASMAAALRRLADKVEENTAKPRPSIKTLEPDLGSVAYEVLKDIDWGVANLASQSLITTAQDHDTAAAVLRDRASDSAHDVLLIDPYVEGHLRFECTCGHPLANSRQDARVAFDAHLASL